MHFLAGEDSWSLSLIADQVKPRAFAPCSSWLLAFLSLAFSMGVCRVRPSFACGWDADMTGMQNELLLQNSEYTGGVLSLGTTFSHLYGVWLILSRITFLTVDQSVSVVHENTYIITLLAYFESFFELCHDIRVLPWKILFNFALRAHKLHSGSAVIQPWIQSKTKEGGFGGNKYIQIFEGKKTQLSRKWKLFR